MSKSTYRKESIIKLILTAQNGDFRAVEELIRRVQKQIYSIFSHLTDKKDDISDLTQEALIKMAKSLYQLKDVKKFKPWLNQIITNVFNDYIKKHPKSFVELDEEKLNEIKDKIKCEPGQKCMFSEIEKLVKTALLTLPQNYRIAIILREYEGLSYQDIAKIMNTTIGTVKSRISRARLKLQEELKEFI